MAKRTRLDLLIEIDNIESHIKMLLSDEYLESIGANVNAPTYQRPLHLRCMRILDDLSNRLAAEQVAKGGH